MKSLVGPDMREVMDSYRLGPAVSIIIPFETKITARGEIMHAVNLAADKVEKVLARRYPLRVVRLLMVKLKSLIGRLNYNTFKKSIAIYVSPVFEKILYLDVAVEERIIIDRSFSIRDLVYSKKEIFSYLLLQLSAEEARIYLGNSNGLARILSNSRSNISLYQGNASAGHPKRISLEAYLRSVDQALGHVLHAEPLPLFVAGRPRILGHFRHTSVHTGSVVQYVEGNHEGATTRELTTMIAPFVSEWKTIRERDLLNKLMGAERAGKLISGMSQVREQATRGNGKLLVVEKNYLCPHGPDDEEDPFLLPADPQGLYAQSRDLVDEVIERTLGAGGDVEFVEPGLLNDRDRIALILAR